MADEAAETPEETQDTLAAAEQAAAEAPSADPTPGESGTPAEQPDTDWEKRYKDLQSEYTRTTQEAAELRRAQEAQQADESYVEALSDPETQEAALASLTEQLGDEQAKEWLEAHGFEIEEAEEDDLEFRDPRVDQILSEREQERAAQQQHAVEQAALQVEQQMEKDLQQLAKAKGLDELPEGIQDLILDAAVVRPDGDGHPDVKAAFDQWAAANDAAIKAYRAGKRDQPSPPNRGGSSGTPNPSQGDRKAALDLANQIAEEAYQSS